MVSSCEHGQEGSTSIKGGEFLSQLNDYQLLKKSLRSMQLECIQPSRNAKSVVIPIR